MVFKVFFSILIAFIAIESVALKTLDSSLGESKVGDIISDLENKVYSYQVLKAQNYTPPFKWAELLGLFRSDIRINFIGGPIESELRNSDLTAIFDNDMFSTGWIITALMESMIYGTNTPKFDESRLNLALNEINNYHNKNEQPDTPLMTFWPQVYNATNKLWTSQPINIRNLILSIDKLPWDEIVKFLELLHLDKLANILNMIKTEGDQAIKAFQIPPDFDDTYLYFGIGATLFKLKDVYPTVYDTWTKANINLDHLVADTIKYAYRPFDSDPNKNIIDPRTYFYARPFLLEAQKNNQSVALITTWIQNIDEQRVLASKGISMPFNLNNVDVTVCANSIYGMASGAIYNINGYQDYFASSNDLQQIFLNTTKFISWAIKTNFTSRPDLAQVYYPSKFNFLWYASRTLFLLENEIEGAEFGRRLSAPLKAVLIEAKGYLKDAFQNTVTQLLLNTAEHDPKVPNEVYFDDFLGVNDTDLFGKQKPTGEDRIFSTAQAINILISTWTVQDPKTKKLIWKKGVTQDTKTLMQNAINWLQANVVTKTYKPLNAFFSGSVKGFDSLPFWYPANFYQFLNGTNVDPSTVPESELGSLIGGVKGVIDEETYQQLIKEKHFGYDTPVDFHGYNVKDNFFPFWGSQPYTYAVSILAISQYTNISN